MLWISNHSKKHKIQRGESVSKLLDKDFLKKGGTINDEGLKALKFQILKLRV
jgi:hypothetical protein